MMPLGGQHSWTVSKSHIAPLSTSVCTRKKKSEKCSYISAVIDFFKSFILFEKKPTVIVKDVVSAGNSL